VADVFATGCIFAELFTGDPLLPGSSESDMLHRLSKLIGCVPQAWKQGFDVAAGIGLTNLPGALVEPSYDQIIQNLQKVIPSANAQAIDLISQMIAWNPKDRPTCEECLQHPFLGGKQTGYNQRQSGSFKQTNTSRGAPQFELHRYKDSTLRRIAANSSE